MTRAQMAEHREYAGEQMAECMANGHWRIADWWADQAFTWHERLASCA